MMRNLKHCLQHCKQTAYIPLVWSTLEYAASVWYQYYVKDAAKLEQLHHEAVQFIIGDYSTRQDRFITQKMNDIELLTLQARKKAIRLALLYKVVNGLVPAINSNEYLTKQTSQRCTKPVIYND